MKKPMSAAKYVESKAKFPYFAQPKIDGIRCIIKDGQALSKSLKPIRNLYIQSVLANMPDGLDGELIVGNNIRDTTSGVMSINSKPDFKYHIFDYCPDKSANLTFEGRLTDLLSNVFPTLCNHPHISFVHTEVVFDAKDLQSYIEHCAENGYEGVILRNPDSYYKEGKCTTKENILLKIKSFEDSEAKIIGFREEILNNNPQVVNNLGKLERSSKKEGLVPKNTLGALLVQDIYNDKVFSVGTGFDQELRKKIWDNQQEYLHKIIKYSYFPYGEKSKPRHPSFLTFRDPDDI